MKKENEKRIIRKGNENEKRKRPCLSYKLNHSLHLEIAEGWGDIAPPAMDRVWILVFLVSKS